MEYFKEIITPRKWCLWGISSKLFFISSIHHPPLNLEHLLSHGNSTWENIALLVFYHRLPLLSLSKAQLHQHAERKASIFAGSLSDLTPKCLYFFFFIWGISLIVVTSFSFFKPVIEQKMEERIFVLYFYYLATKLLLGLFIIDTNFRTYEARKRKTYFPWSWTNPI